MHILLQQLFKALKSYIYFIIKYFKKLFTTNFIIINVYLKIYVYCLSPPPPRPVLPAICLLFTRSSLYISWLTKCYNSLNLTINELLTIVLTRCLLNSPCNSIGERGERFTVDVYFIFRNIFLTWIYYECDADVVTRGMLKLFAYLPLKIVRRVRPTESLLPC